MGGLRLLVVAVSRCALTHRVIVLHTLIPLMYYCGGCASPFAPDPHPAPRYSNDSQKSMSWIERVVISNQKLFLFFSFFLLQLQWSCFHDFLPVFFFFFCLLKPRVSLINLCRREEHLTPGLWVNMTETDDLNHFTYTGPASPPGSKDSTIMQFQLQPIYI